MRHRVYGKHLGRNKDERRLLFKGLMHSLFLHGTIQTSEAKAKAIKGLVDRVINLAKIKTARDQLQSFLTDKNLQDRLVKDIVPNLGTRTSGYTRLVRVGPRFGDQTMMVRMSLIGSEELKPLEKESRIKKQGLSKKTREPQTKQTKAVASPKRSVKHKKTQVRRRSKKA